MTYHIQDAAERRYVEESARTGIPLFSMIGSNKETRLSRAS